MTISFIGKYCTVPDTKKFVSTDFSSCLSQSVESVLSALSGCKILRELSKLEDETETKLSMKELAQRFENLAHGETMNTSSTNVQSNKK